MDPKSSNGMLNAVFIKRIVAKVQWFLLKLSWYIQFSGIKKLRHKKGRVWPTGQRFFAGVTEAQNWAALFWQHILGAAATVPVPHIFFDLFPPVLLGFTAASFKRLFL